MAAGTLLISCDATTPTRKRRVGSVRPMWHPCLNDSEVGDQAQIEKHQDEYQKQDQSICRTTAGKPKEITEGDRGAQQRLIAIRSRPQTARTGPAASSNNRLFTGGGVSGERTVIGVG